MKRFFSLLCALLALPLLFACNAPDEAATTTGNTDYSMTATVSELGDQLLVDVSESASNMIGPYLINTDKGTVYRDAEGNAIARDDIKVGDTIVIYFSGQVMMSYPAQVYAAKIVLK